MTPHDQHLHDLGWALANDTESSYGNARLVLERCGGRPSIAGMVLQLAKQLNVDAPELAIRILKPAIEIGMPDFYF